MSNDVSFKMQGDIAHTFDWVAENGPRYYKAALMAGAQVLKDKTKENLISMIPASTNRNPKYNDTLVDAIRNGPLAQDHVKVHVLGTRAKGSGTYRTRFFENGTRDRYQKSYRGVKLKDKRFLGKITPKNFFSSAITSEQQNILAAMQQVLDNFMQKANEI